MKTAITLLLLLALVTGCRPTGQAPTELVPATQPNAAQQALMERQYGMFIHFGVNTFTNHEWSDGTTPASAYHPTQLDCDQWV